MNVYIPYTRLPAEYQEVEYIQSTGTQAIDCNIVIGATKLKTDLKINSQYIGESAIFLSRWALNGNFLMFYNNAFRWHSASAVDISCALNTDYSIQTENGKITINGTSYTCTASSSDSGSDLSMCIFGRSGATTYGRFKLYYMKMWNNTTLVRDLVPCYRKSDNVIGMYDTVNNQFYTNSGTGTFSKGNDVTMSEVQNIYIGEYKEYTPTANTIAYYPLKEDVLDYSGNNRNLSQGGITLTTFNGVKCGYNNGGNGTIFRGSSNNTESTITASYWYYSTASNDYTFCIGGDIGGNLDCDTEIVSFYANGSNDWTYSTTTEKNKWINIVVTLSGGNMSFYKDGQLLGTRSCSNILWKNICVGSNSLGTSPSNLNLHGYVSNCILENKARTAQEISDYYNQTKSNYGL